MHRFPNMEWSIAPFPLQRSSWQNTMSVVSPNCADSYVGITVLPARQNRHVPSWTGFPSLWPYFSWSVTHRPVWLMVCVSTMLSKVIKLTKCCFVFPSCLAMFYSFLHLLPVSIGHKQRRRSGLHHTHSIRSILRLTHWFDDLLLEWAK